MQKSTGAKPDVRFEPGNGGILATVLSKKRDGIETFYVFFDGRLVTISREVKITDPAVDAWKVISRNLTADSSIQIEAGNAASRLRKNLDGSADRTVSFSMTSRAVSNEVRMAFDKAHEEKFQATELPKILE